MLTPELKSSQRHPPSPKELGEMEVKLRVSNMTFSVKLMDLVKKCDMAVFTLNLHASLILCQGSRARNFVCCTHILN